MENSTKFSIITDMQDARCNYLLTKMGFWLPLWKLQLCNFYFQFDMPIICNALFLHLFKKNWIKYLLSLPNSTNNGFHNTSENCMLNILELPIRNEEWLDVFCFNGWDISNAYFYRWIQLPRLHWSASNFSVVVLNK